MKNRVTVGSVAGALLALVAAATTAEAQSDAPPVPVAVTNAVKVESILNPVGIVAPMFTPARLVSAQGVVEAGVRTDLLFDDPLVGLRDVSVAGLSTPENGCLLQVFVNDVLVKVGIVIPPWYRPRPWPRGAAFPAGALIGDWALPAVNLTPNDRLGFELKALGSGPGSAGKCRAMVVALATLPAV